MKKLLNLGKKKDPGAGKKVGYPALKRAITNVNGLISKAQGAAKSGATLKSIFEKALSGGKKKNKKE